MTTSAGPEPAVKYAAVIDNVKEVMLIGRADLQHWNAHLRSVDLYPYVDDGRAQLAITGTELRWKGITFKELTISVAVSSQSGGNSHDGYFLAHAYNSVAALALMERLLFHTPYYHANLDVGAAQPVRVQLVDGQQSVFEARMSPRSAIAAPLDSMWSGPIFLPRRKGRDRTQGEYFSAKLGGSAEVYPFDPARDTLVLPRNHDPIWRWLAESGFTASEWRIRHNAHHAKSKTYRR